MCHIRAQPTRFVHIQATMASWPYSVHSHPWFRMPSQKRKAYEYSDSSDSSDPDTYSLPPKRRRYDGLENGFAQLSLNPALRAAQLAQSPYDYPSSPSVLKAPPVAQLEPAFDVWSAQSMVRDPPPHLSPIILPGSVEEPTSPAAGPDIPEVTMKSRSWYEPEKDRE